jgi:hypothetical protein
MGAEGRLPEPNLQLKRHDWRTRMGIEIGGIFGLLVLIADIWAIVNIVQSSAGTGRKVLWIVLVLLLPVLGLILWFLLGPRTGKA